MDESSALRLVVGFDPTQLTNPVAGDHYQKKRRVIFGDVSNEGNQQQPKSLKSARNDRPNLINGQEQVRRHDDDDDDEEEGGKTGKAHSGGAVPADGPFEYLSSSLGHAHRSPSAPTPLTSSSSSSSHRFEQLYLDSKRREQALAQRRAEQSQQRAADEAALLGSEAFTFKPFIIGNSSNGKSHPSSNGKTAPALSIFDRLSDLTLVNQKRRQREEEERLLSLGHLLLQPLQKKRQQTKTMAGDSRSGSNVSNSISSKTPSPASSAARRSSSAAAVLPAAGTIVSGSTKSGSANPPTATNSAASSRAPSSSAAPNDRSGPKAKRPSATPAPTTSTTTAPVMMNGRPTINHNYDKILAERWQKIHAQAAATAAATAAEQHHRHDDDTDAAASSPTAAAAAAAMATISVTDRLYGNALHKQIQSQMRRAQTDALANLKERHAAMKREQIRREYEEAKREILVERRRMEMVDNHGGDGEVCVGDGDGRSGKSGIKSEMHRPNQDRRDDGLSPLQKHQRQRREELELLLAADPSSPLGHRQRSPRQRQHHHHQRRAASANDVSASSSTLLFLDCLSPLTEEDLRSIRATSSERCPVEDEHESGSYSYSHYSRQYYHPHDRHYDDAIGHHHHADDLSAQRRDNSHVSEYRSDAAGKGVGSSSPSPSPRNYRRGVSGGDAEDNVGRPSSASVSLLMRNSVDRSRSAGGSGGGTYTSNFLLTLAASHSPSSHGSPSFHRDASPHSPNPTNSSSSSSSHHLMMRTPHADNTATSHSHSQHRRHADPFGHPEHQQRQCQIYGHDEYEAREEEVVEVNAVGSGNDVTGYDDHDEAEVYHRLPIRSTSPMEKEEEEKGNGSNDNQRLRDCVSAPPSPEKLAETMRPTQLHSSSPSPPASVASLSPPPSSLPAAQRASGGQRDQILEFSRRSDNDGKGVGQQEALVKQQSSSVSYPSVWQRMTQKSSNNTSGHLHAKQQPKQRNNSVPQSRSTSADKILLRNIPTTTTTTATTVSPYQQLPIPPRDTKASHLRKQRSTSSSGAVGGVRGRRPSFTWMTSSSPSTVASVAVPSTAVHQEDNTLSGHRSAAITSPSTPPIAVHTVPSTALTAVPFASSSSSSSAPSVSVNNGSNNTTVVTTTAVLAADRGSSPIDPSTFMAMIRDASSSSASPPREVHVDHLLFRSRSSSPIIRQEGVTASVSDDDRIIGANKEGEEEDKYISSVAIRWSPSAPSTVGEQGKYGTDKKVASPLVVRDDDAEVGNRGSSQSPPRHHHHTVSVMSHSEGGNQNGGDSAVYWSPSRAVDDGATTVQINHRDSLTHRAGSGNNDDDDKTTTSEHVAAADSAVSASVRNVDEVDEPTRHFYYPPRPIVHNAAEAINNGSTDDVDGGTLSSSPFHFNCAKNTGKAGKVTTSMARGGVTTSISGLNESRDGSVINASGPAPQHQGDDGTDNRGEDEENKEEFFFSAIPRRSTSALPPPILDPLFPSDPTSVYYDDDFGSEKAPAPLPSSPSAISSHYSPPPPTYRSLNYSAAAAITDHIVDNATMKNAHFVRLSSDYAAASAGNLFVGDDYQAADSNDIYDRFSMISAQNQKPISVDSKFSPPPPLPSLQHHQNNHASDNDNKHGPANAMATRSTSSGVSRLPSYGYGDSLMSPETPRQQRHDHSPPSVAGGERQQYDNPSVRWSQSPPTTTVAMNNNNGVNGEVEGEEGTTLTLLEQLQFSPQPNVRQGSIGLEDEKKQKEDRTVDAKSSPPTLHYRESNDAINGKNNEETVWSPRRLVSAVKTRSISFAPKDDGDDDDDDGDFEVYQSPLSHHNTLSSPSSALPTQHDDHQGVKEGHLDPHHPHQHARNNNIHSDHEYEHHPHWRRIQTPSTAPLATTTTTATNPSAEETSSVTTTTRPVLSTIHEPSDEPHSQQLTTHQPELVATKNDEVPPLVTQTSGGDTSPSSSSASDAPPSASVVPTPAVTPLHTVSTTAVPPRAHMCTVSTVVYPPRFTAEDHDDMTHCTFTPSINTHVNATRYASVKPRYIKNNHHDTNVKKKIASVALDDDGDDDDDDTRQGEEETITTADAPSFSLEGGTSSYAVTTNEYDAPYSSPIHSSQPMHRNEPSWRTTLSMETVHSSPARGEEEEKEGLLLHSHYSSSPLSLRSPAAELCKSPSVALRERLMHGPTTVSSTTTTTAASPSVARTFYSMASSDFGHTKSVLLPTMAATSSAPLVNGFCLSPERAWKSCQSTRTTTSSAATTLQVMHTMGKDNDNGNDNITFTSLPRSPPAVQEAHYFYSSSASAVQSEGIVADGLDDSPAPAPRPSCGATAVARSLQSCCTSASASLPSLPLMCDCDDEDEPVNVGKKGKGKEVESEEASKIITMSHHHLQTTTTATPSLAFRIAQRLLEQSSNRHVERQLLARQHKKEAMEKLMRTGGGSSGGSHPSQKQ